MGDDADRVKTSILQSHALLFTCGGVRLEPSHRCALTTTELTPLDIRFTEYDYNDYPSDVKIH